MQSADALLRLLNDILDFSKVEAGKLELETIDFPLRDSLGDAMHTFGFRAAEKGVELAYLVPPDVPDTLLGDPGRLRQIVINLVGNALKFTDRGEIVVVVTVDEREESQVAFALRGQRHRDRHSRGQAAADFRGVQPGRHARPPAATAAPGWD